MLVSFGSVGITLQVTSRGDVYMYYGSELFMSDYFLHSPCAFGKLSVLITVWHLRHSENKMTNHCLGGGGRGMISIEIAENLFFEKGFVIQGFIFISINECIINCSCDLAA